MIKLTREQILSIPAKTKAGETFKDISIEFGCSRAAIDGAVRRLRANGIEVITKRGRKPVKLT
jgi:biotin operon repressor